MKCVKENNVFERSVFEKRGRYTGMHRLTGSMKIGMPYVYFVWAVGSGMVKIGKSVNPFKRIDGLRTGCPYDLVMVLCLPQRRWISELELHRAFKHLRVREKKGEWFWFEDDILDLINLIQWHGNSVKDGVLKDFFVKLEKRVNGKS